ncbi:uncharacterized protein LOC127794015 [Diospyros lotus]|uniref:uncharacterized protein LOC127794015 n=1 Tax=Diospyros lotus TaxID=55363 RepID=UPI00224C9DAE|nr:uncharacterized protein LOC127794015 [Diospyros lotus]
MATESRELSHKDAESMEEMAFPGRRCCFCIPCFGSGSSPIAGAHWWQRMRGADYEDRWWSRGISALKKVREWSEIVAGPRWKTFIRRFNRNKSGGGRHCKFQYDPLSYALNFDEGAGQSGSPEEEYGFRNFSARYAAIPMPGADHVKNAPTYA